MSSLPLILITGATGYIGSHVAQHARASGYPVRLLARKTKAEGLRTLHINDKDVDVVAFDDLATGDFTQVLKGVGAIIHVAFPLPGREDTAGMLQTAVEGTLNIVRQATAAGVNKVVVTSTLAVLTTSPMEFLKGHVITPNDWNDATTEQVKDGTHDADVYWTYTAVKTIAEKKLWEFADEHPEIEVTTILPPMVYGPILPGTKIENKAALIGYSMIGITFYAGVFPEEGSAGKLKPVQDVFPFTIDVRDVAKAHILALTAPPTSKVGRKRFIIAGEGFYWKDAVEHLLTVRPELRSRLPDTSEATKMTLSTLDCSRAKEVLGLDAYIDWRKTVEDTADSIISIEKSWSA